MFHCITGLSHRADTFLLYKNASKAVAPVKKNVAFWSARLM
jgi:hypothetical protein